MLKFVKLENGVIVEGPIGAEEVPEGFTEYQEIVDLPPNYGEVVSTVELVDGICVKTVTGKTSYAKQRQNSYPGLGEQLDMFWHAMDAGVIPKVEPFYSAIANVKTQYPKPPL